MGAPGSACAARESPALEPRAPSLLRHVRLENLAAGVSGGVLATLALHPLDLVKIRFAVSGSPVQGRKTVTYWCDSSGGHQTGEGAGAHGIGEQDLFGLKKEKLRRDIIAVYDYVIGGLREVSDGLELRPKYNGIFHCMFTVWKHEGLRGLYQGVTPNMVGAGASWGLYFFFYNAIKAYKKEGKMESLSATEHLVSAAEAGAMTLCITNPVWVTKTRLVLQYNAGVDPSKRQYRGMVDALVKIYKTEGIRGLYKGFVPGLFGTSHGALQFMAYEDLKERYNKYRNRVSDTKLNTVEYITMAAVSKIFAVSATYPYQVVRARLQDQHNTYSGVFDVIRRTWRLKNNIDLADVGLLNNEVSLELLQLITQDRSLVRKPCGALVVANPNSWQGEVS
ncbi:hypothetical protein BTVI_155886 [Pitangus sulphuratus]|nr:hypothetical protein BTVI_155886 [Pitangus sulphuratus]